jgi:hypothetical protein
MYGTAGTIQYGRVGTLGTRYGGMVPGTDDDDDDDLIQQPYDGSTRVNFKLQLISIFPSSIFFSSFFECSVRQSEVRFDPFYGVQNIRTLEPVKTYFSSFVMLFIAACNIS